MKKMVFLSLIVFASFVMAVDVEAETVGDFNYCTNSTTDNLGGGRCDEINSSPQTTNADRTFYEDPFEDCNPVNYNVAIVLDSSSSMTDPACKGCSQRYVYANDALVKVIDALGDLKSVTGADYNISVFELYDGPKGGRWYNISELYNNTELLGSLKLSSDNLNDPTFIQGGLINAYRALTGINNGYAPMLVFVSDGIPTAAGDSLTLSGTGYLTKTFDGTIDQTSQYTWGRVLYHTVNTMVEVSESLHDLNDNAKVFTFQIGDASSLTRLVFNPNGDTLNNYNDNLPGINAIKGDSFVEAEATARGGTNTGRVAYGTASNNNKTLTFKINKNSSQAATDDKGNVEEPLIYFAFNLTKVSTKPYYINTNSNSLSSININGTTYGNCVFSNSDGNFTCTSSNGGRILVEDKYDGVGTSDLVIYELLNLENNKKYCNSSNKYCSGMTITFNFKNSLSVTNFSAVTYNGTLLSEMSSGIIVDAYIEATGDDFINEFVEQIIKGICSANQGDSGYSVNGTDYNSNCVDRSTSISGNLYYQVCSIFYNSSGNLIMPGDCVEVIGNNIPYIITETLEFDIGSLKERTSIYAGGGFAWTNAYVKNTYDWYYKLLAEDGSPMFSRITLDAYTTSNVSGGTSKVSISNVSISSLYTDDTCTNSLSVDTVENAVETSALGNVNTNMSSDISDSFDTIDSDTGEEGDKISPIVSSSSEGKTYSYNISLQRACLSKNGRTVRYTNGSCFDDETDGGILRYTPLKYPTGSFNVNAIGNYSSVDGITLNVNVSCPVDIAQILYDDSGDEVAYTYRSIDHNDPFPKGVIPFNWQAFMDSGGRTRLSDSYLGGNLNYEISFMDEDLDDIANGNDYTNWSNIDVETGSSEFANNIKRNATYCPLGEFRDDCD